MKRLVWLLVLLPLLLTGCLLPPGVHISVGGGANYYDAPTRTIALASNQPVAIQAHEACHAHQHEMVLEKNPTSDNLWLYFGTSEGMAFLALRNQAPSEGALEDAAWVCAYYFTDPSRLTPDALAWAEEWLGNSSPGA